MKQKIPTEVYADLGEGNENYPEGYVAQRVLSDEEKIRRSIIRDMEGLL